LQVGFGIRRLRGSSDTDSVRASFYMKGLRAPNWSSRSSFTATWNIGLPEGDTLLRPSFAAASVLGGLEMHARQVRSKVQLLSRLDLAKVFGDVIGVLSGKVLELSGNLFFSSSRVAARNVREAFCFPFRLGTCLVRVVAESLLASRVPTHTNILAMSTLSVGIRYPYDRKRTAWSMPSCVLKPSTSGYL